MKGMLIAAILVLAAGCASKQDSEPAIRIGDTIQAALDTANPDTARDSVTE